MEEFLSDPKMSQIRKRDGRIVKFEIDKIADAIAKAFVATKTPDGEIAIKLARQVFEALMKKGFSDKKIPSVEDVQDAVEQVLIENKFAEVAKAYIIYRQRRAEIREAKKLIGVTDELKLGVNATKVLQRRYLLKDDKGNIVETPTQLFRRVAGAIAVVDKFYDPKADVQATAESFYKMMANFEFIPNTPTLMNAGTPIGQLSACFVLPVGDSLKEILDTVKWTAVIHQCLTGDTLVMTDGGLKPISEIGPGSVVMTDEGPFVAESSHKNSLEEVFEINTTHGYSIKGSAEHKFMVVDDKGELSWRKLSELKPGDWMTLNVGGWLGGNTVLPKFEFVIKKGGNQTSFKPEIYTLPRELTPELSELIGMFVGGGSWHRDGIRFTVAKKDKGMLKRIEHICKGLFSRHVATTNDKRENAFDVCILSRQIKEWLLFLGVDKPSTWKAYVPSIILKSTPENAAAFLRGLFSTDGCIGKKGYITLSSVSERLIKTVQLMLLHLGIPSRIYVNRRVGFGKMAEIYQLSICTVKGWLNFRKKIGFSSYPKQKRLLAIDPDIFSMKMEKIPNQRSALRVVYDSFDPLETGVFNSRWGSILLGRRELSKEVASSAGGLLLKHETDQIQKLLTNNLFYAQIKSVRYIGKENVYDLTVPTKHAYIANGFVSHNSGGGTGFSFSRLRPKGDVVKSTKGIASGAVSFIRIFDTTTDVIKQGGRRRGANMGILRVDHPDIIDFITSKSKPGMLENFNISVAATDKFMEAVERDREYELINPRNNEVTGKLRAREVFDLISTMAWQTGDPGLIFIDRINRANATTQLLGPIEATNPCGEQPLHPWESCNLGSINVSKFVKQSGKKPDIDWQRLRETIQKCIHFLDNVVDANKYPLPEIERITKANRRIGLGIMGWADLLIQLGIPYDSQQAVKLGEKFMKWFHAESLAASQALATKRGDFPNFAKSALAKKYKHMRNVAVNTIAPTGTISIIANCSSGIEPLFAISYVRNVMEGTRLLEVNPYFESVAKERGFYSKDLMTEIAKTGSIQQMTNLPSDIRRIFVTALDIAPEWHVRMQAAFQKNTDNAVSKTVNLPSEATPEDVKKIYWLAYKLGCKGITIYRYGSKPEQVLYIGAEELKQKLTTEPKLVAAESEYSGGCPTPGTCPG